jgi:hypothetical protein
VVLTLLIGSDRQNLTGSDTNHGTACNAGPTGMKRLRVLYDSDHSSRYRCRPGQQIEFDLQVDDDHVKPGHLDALQCLHSLFQTQTEAL